MIRQLKMTDLERAQKKAGIEIQPATLTQAAKLIAKGHAIVFVESLSEGKAKEILLRERVQESKRREATQKARNRKYWKDRREWEQQRKDGKIR